MTHCDLPPGLEQEARSLAFDQDTIPNALCREHSLRSGRWGVLRVLAGKVTFVDFRSETHVELVAGDTLLIEPEAPHELRLHGEPFRCQIDFYQRSAD